MTRTLPSSAGALLLLALLSALAVAAGLQAVAQQEAALARIAAGHRAEVARVQAQYANGGEAGYAAYSTPHLTTHPPAPLAFAAWGQRDVQPAALRVRLLGLQAQLYESETVNPELALPGRFDFAFVLVYLAPLFVIALMHDLAAGEREAGRLRLLASMPAGAGRIWHWRVGLRFALVLLALGAPFVIGAVVAHAPAGAAALVLLAVALYLAFWFGLSAWIAALAKSAASSAAILLACLIVLTMVLPTAVNAAIARAVPVARGVELALAQRQEVHNGWDLPKPVTFEKFFRTHPEWKDTPPVTGRFHWKWYYAMHQAGDDAVAPQLAAYRQAMQEREAWTARAGWLLAPVSVQVLLHRLARTDLQAQLDYQDRIAAFHKELRRFFYPFIFHERSFGPREFAQLPQYRTERAERGVAGEQASALPLAWPALLAGGMAWLGMRRLRDALSNG
jgi:ABC-2 type transport system permease protein